MADMSPSDTALVGAALARLHLAGAPLAARFERPGIYTFPDIAARFHGFRDRPDPALQPVVPALASAIAEIEAQAAQRERAARGVIHADLFPDNVIFTPGPEPGIALIDFEQACTGSLLYDLAVCLTSWCYRDDFVAELVRAMVAGYRQVRPLDASDLDLLHLEARVAAVRFTVTRITDIHLAGVDNPAKDFRRYAARLASLRALGSDGFAALVGRCD
jgi:homoserine kinase type II